MTLAGFCDQCDARYKPGARFCGDCGAPRMELPKLVPAEALSAVDGATRGTTSPASAPSGSGDRREPDSATTAPPIPKVRWEWQVSTPLTAGHRVTRALLTALSVAGLGLLLLSTQDVSLWNLIGWAPFAQLMAGVALMVRAVLPARVNQQASAVAGSVAASVVAWQFSQMTALVPNWVFLFALAAACACVVMTILSFVESGLSLAGSAAAEEDAPASAGPALAYELMLLTCAVTAAALVANLASDEVSLRSAAALAAIAALAAWGLRVLRTGCERMICWLVLGLSVLPGVAAWTAFTNGSVTTLCLATAAVVALAQPLRACTPWAKLGAGARRWTPPVGIGPRRHTLTMVVADLLSWLRTGWSAVLRAGLLFWLTPVLVVVGALALAVAPLALISQVGSYLSDTGAVTERSTPVWLVVGLLSGTGLVVYVLASVCAQALVAAVAEHDRGGQLYGRRLAGRALSILGKQFSTVLRYSLGVVFGTIMGVIPGLMLQVRWAFAVPVGATVGVSGSDALKASWRFTRHRFWRTLIGQATAIVVALVFVLVAAALAFAANAVYGSALVAAVAAFVPITFGVTCTTVIMASLYRKYLGAPIRLTDHR